MSVRERNNVRVSGAGVDTIIFAHGFGCDLNMWRLLEPIYATRYRTVMFDHVGAGESDLRAYEVEKYSTLEGYAQDVVEIAREFGQGRSIFVGHSVSAMIGMLADLASPGLFAGHAMIGPSPCYVNDRDYVGGFSREDVDSLLRTLEGNYLGWSSNMAPVIMGAPDSPSSGRSCPTASVAPTRTTRRASLVRPFSPTIAPSFRGSRPPRSSSSATTTSSRRSPWVSTWRAPCRTPRWWSLTTSATVRT